MFVLKNTKNFYIKIEDRRIKKTVKFIEATKFRTPEAAQTVLDLSPGRTKPYRICDVYNNIVYPKGRKKVIFTRREKQMIYQKAECRCQICGREITYSEMTLDHIIPLAMGGEDSINNLQASCAKCNHEKAAFLPEEYFDMVNRTFFFQMDKKYYDNLLWKLAKFFVKNLERQA